MDYRLSHISNKKGEMYSSSFEALPYRKMIWNWERLKLLDFIDKTFEHKPSIDYLDFACGTGRIIGLIEKNDKVHRAFGVDVSESMLNVAREKLTKSRLHLLDITRNNIFPRESFDLITAFRFFLNAQWDLKIEAMQKLSTLIKPDGYIIFNIHMNSGCTLDRLSRAYSNFKKTAATYKTMNSSEVKELTKSANLKIIDTYHFGVIPVVRENAKLPYEFIYKIETLLSHIPSFAPFSRYSIYVCKKDSSN